MEGVNNATTAPTVPIPINLMKSLRDSFLFIKDSQTPLAVMIIIFCFKFELGIIRIRKKLKIYQI